MNQDSKSNRTELSAAQQSKVDKAYAAYLSGWLGKSIFDAWFPFFAHIILEQESDQIDVVKIRDKFNERYSIRVPMEFIHQVLAIGNKNGMFSYNKQCVAVVDKVRLEKELEPADGDYKKQWEVLCCAFKDFCNGREIVFEEEEQIKNIILNCIEKYDTRVVLSVDSQESEDEDVDVKIEFAWNKFVASVSKSNLEMFDFICSLSYGSILKEAIFLTGENESAFRGLTVFLDSPIIFALLGIGEDARVELVQSLVENLGRAGCHVYVYQHTVEEVELILRAAKKWATDLYGYRVDRASLSAQYFRNKRMLAQEIDAIIADVPGDLRTKFKIFVKDACYSKESNAFQIDESRLEEIFNERYAIKHNGRMPEGEKRSSILTDIRSLAMIYRARGRRRPSRFQDAKFIMVTTSATLASVSKTFERERSSAQYVIPACTTANLFGSVLWLSQPKKMFEYKKLEVMADCARFLRPTEGMCKKFYQKIEELKRGKKISKEKYFIITTSHATTDELMDITSGDETCLTDSTVDEVYERLTEKISGPIGEKYEHELSVVRSDYQQREESRIRKWERILSNIAYFLSWGVYAVLLSCVTVSIEMVKTECFKAVLLNIVMLGIAAAEEIHLSMVKRMVAGFARKIAIKIAKIL